MSAYSHAPPPYAAVPGAHPHAAYQAAPYAQPSGSKTWTQLVRGTHDELYAAWDSGVLGAAAPPEVRGRSLALRTDGDRFHWSEFLQSVTWHERGFGPALAVVRFATHIMRSDSFEMQAAGTSSTLASWKDRTGALQIGKRKLTAQPDKGLQRLDVELDGRACVWECTRELRTVEGHRWDMCTYGLYDAKSRELLASFRWLTGAPKHERDMTLYMWDTSIDELLVLSSFSVLLFQQWCRMVIEWNNLYTPQQLAVYEGLCEDESTRHTYGYVSAEKAVELRERAAQLQARRGHSAAHSGAAGIMSANAAVFAVGV